VDQANANPKVFAHKTVGQAADLVPWASAKASFDRERRNEGVTEIVEIPNRGHAPTIDGGWRNCRNGIGVPATTLSDGESRMRR
jgi:hypothetical protein